MLVCLISHREADKVMQPGMRALRDFCVIIAVGSPRGGKNSDKSCNAKKNNALCLGTLKFRDFQCNCRLCFNCGCKCFLKKARAECSEGRLLPALSLTDITWSWGPAAPISPGAALPLKESPGRM